VAREKSNTARTLARVWGLDVKHALYRQSGDWYHLLERFPAALMDENGFVIFETEDAYLSCPSLRIGQRISVRNGISAIPGYTLGANSTLGASSDQYESSYFSEGGRQEGAQSRIERSGPAREACIAAHGLKCTVCGLDFEDAYGALGAGFIHVHHLEPLSQGVREVDPVGDMRPLCPNCHAMAHREEPPVSLDRLRKIWLGGSHR
jgi:hypothetical protein